MAKKLTDIKKKYADMLLEEKKAEKEKTAEKEKKAGKKLEKKKCKKK